MNKRKSVKSKSTESPTVDLTVTQAETTVSECADSVIHDLIHDLGVADAIAVPGPIHTLEQYHTHFTHCEPGRYTLRIQWAGVEQILPVEWTGTELVSTYLQ